MKYVFKEEKFEGKSLFVLYERDERNVDIAIADSPNPLTIRKYKRRLETSPGVERS